MKDFTIMFAIDHFVFSDVLHCNLRMIKVTLPPNQVVIAAGDMMYSSDKVVKSSFSIFVYIYTFRELLYPCSLT